MTEWLRPKTMLDHELIHDLCEIVSRGNFRLTACQRVGLSYRTFKKWLQKGKAEILAAADNPDAEPSLYMQLVLALEACEASMQQSLVQDVANGDLKAKMWFLTHRWNKQFNRNTNTVIDDDAAEEVRIDPAIVLADRLKELAEKL